MRALVLLGGELRRASWDQLSELSGSWDTVVCADSGGRHALQLGISVDVLIGDFDSLAPKDQLSLAGATVIRYPRGKDATDGQLAVTEALRRGATELVLAGAFGGRLDHALASLALLRQIHDAGARGIATDGYQTAYLTTNELTLTGPPGRVFSVLPMTEVVTGVHLEGCRWPLRNVRLAHGDTLTLSNEFTSGPVNIRLATGSLLVIVTYHEAQSQGGRGNLNSIR